MIHVLRHAHAGKRGSHDPDANRPLSDRGLIQSKLVAERLSLLGVKEIHTSPYLRCAQTADRVAEVADVPVIMSPILMEGAPPGPILDLIDGADGIVLCGHGDVLEAVLAELGVRGEGGEARIAKGGCWDLEMDGRTVVAATYHPPPA